jgi:hypothetical protein
MRKGTEEKLAKLFKDICFQGKKTPSGKNVYLFGTTYGAVGLHQRGYENLKSILGLISEIPAIANRGISLELIKKEVHALVGQKVVQPPDVILTTSIQAVRDLVNLLSNYPVVALPIHLPVWGIKLFPPAFVLSVGTVDLYLVFNAPNRWFYGLTPQGRELLAVDSNPPGGSSYWASVKIVGNPSDQSYLASEAERKVSQALSLLVLFIHALPSTETRKTIYASYLPRPATVPLLSEWQNHYVVSDETNHNASRRIRVQTTDLEVRQQDIANFNQSGFKAVCQTLNGQNEIQLRIQKALEMFSTGLRIFEFDQMFVTHVSCLEAMVIEPYEGDIKRKLAKRVSWIMTSSAKERASLMELIEKLYEVRSAIVHQGQVVEYLSRYHAILLGVLYKLVVNLSDGRFETMSEVIEYTNDRKVSCLRRYWNKIVSRFPSKN